MSGRKAYCSKSNIILVRNKYMFSISQRWKVTNYKYFRYSSRFFFFYFLEYN